MATTLGLRGSALPLLLFLVIHTMLVRSTTAEVAPPLRQHTGKPLSQAHPTFKIPVSRTPQSAASIQAPNGARENMLPARKAASHRFAHASTTRPPKQAKGASECHWKSYGKWGPSVDAIKFRVDARGSGLDTEQVMTALREAYAVWHNAVPTLPKLELVSVLDMPSSSHSENRMNGHNQIHFLDTLNKFEAHPIIHETFSWVNDRSEITEVDIVFQSATSDIRWCVADHQPGDPNHWHMIHRQEFDLRSAAVVEFGHALGLGHSESHLHSMQGISYRGEVSKLSLECGDLQGIRSLYGGSSRI